MYNLSNIYTSNLTEMCQNKVVNIRVDPDTGVCCSPVVVLHDIYCISIEFKFVV
jgi:hypothetical protein